ncbi:MAG TPA: D-2-hydroxyacid dehydrogenase [Opitutaceae bacterium]|nr:D-2-hydroxyacid dehydrogenase [Opitutaceae bacterium]
MKIVVLDGHTLNPGDLDWAALQALGECTIHDRSAPAEVISRVADADVVLTNKCPLPGPVLRQLPRLRYIGVLATGHNVVDGATAASLGITVTNVPAYGTRSVAQHVLALILEMTNHVGMHAQSVRAGKWSRSPDFCYWDRPLVELATLTLGIVGYGRIGRAVADLARAFGMEVLATSRRPAPDLELVGLDELFRRADVVSLHCALTPETAGLVNSTRLARMSPTSLLVNTGRGQLIVEADLAAALNAGRIGGAALDVLSVEPPPADHPLLTAKNCLITPHVAWASRAARSRLLATVVENLAGFQAGRPQNVVN